MSEKTSAPDGQAGLRQGQPSAAVHPSSPVPFPGTILRDGARQSGPGHRRQFIRPIGKRDPQLVRDALFTVFRDGTLHVVSEDYSYKSRSYYEILRHELEGRLVRPSSSAVLDAYVVPLCLEQARIAGIPVCPWEISQAYVPLPAIIYGLNYFATSSDFFVARNTGEAKDIIKHVTNKGKYPFCYQKISGDATIHSCTAVFGETSGTCGAVGPIAARIYELFAIPLVRMIVVHDDSGYALSSLAPARYPELSETERAELVSRIVGQEHL